MAECTISPDVSHQGLFRSLRVIRRMRRGPGVRTLSPAQIALRGSRTGKGHQTRARRNPSGIPNTCATRVMVLDFQRACVICHPSSEALRAHGHLMERPLGRFLRRPFHCRRAANHLGGVRRSALQRVPDAHRRQRRLLWPVRIKSGVCVCVYRSVLRRSVAGPTASAGRQEDQRRTYSAEPISGGYTPSSTRRFWGDQD